MLSSFPLMTLSVPKMLCLISRDQDLLNVLQNVWVFGVLDPKETAVGFEAQVVMGNMRTKVLQVPS